MIKYSSRTPYFFCFSLFCLFCLTLVLLSPVPSFAATATKPPQNAQLQVHIDQLEALQKDKKKGMLRESWQELQKKFEGLAQKSSGSTKVKAAYYAAQARESLAKRSLSTWDQKEAVRLYTEVAKLDSAHELAPKALLRAATIAAKQLQDAELASSAVTLLKTRYPKSPQTAQAQKLLAAIPKKANPTDTTPAVPDSSAKDKTPPTKGQAAPAKENTKARDTSKKNLAEQLGLRVKTILLDAGHGGKDPGAEGNGITEKELTLRLVKILGGKLAQKGFTVLYTRQKDTFVQLQDRTELANNKNVDLFISIHVNANNDSAVSGIETYYLNAANSKSAEVVAARENSIPVSQISDLQFILTDLMLTSKTRESNNLGSMVQREILHTMRAGKYRVVDHGVRTAPFYVLMGARMPAILVEIGYLTNKEDAANLKENKYLTLQADAIVQAIIIYRAKVEKAIPQ